MGEIQKKAGNQYTNSRQREINETMERNAQEQGQTIGVNNWGDSCYLVSLIHLLQAQNRERGGNPGNAKMEMQGGETEN